MENLKAVALTICICVISFGIFRSIFPLKHYEKYIRFIFHMIFILILINGILKIAQSDIDNSTDFSFEISENAVKEQLDLHIQNQLNDMLKEKNFKSTITKVVVESNSDQYMIRQIYLNNKDQEREVVDYIKKIAGLDREQIYLVDGSNKE